MSLTGDSRDQLAGLVERILQADADGSDEVDRLLAEFETRVPHPNASNLIYWPDAEELSSEPAAEEIVTQALSHRPFAL